MLSSFNSIYLGMYTTFLCLLAIYLQLVDNFTACNWDVVWSPDPSMDRRECKRVDEGKRETGSPSVTPLIIALYRRSILRAWGRG